LCARSTFGDGNGYRHCEVVQSDERLWIHSAFWRRRQGRLCSHLSRRAGRSPLAKRGTNRRVRDREQSGKRISGQPQGQMTVAISWLAKCPKWRGCVYGHPVFANSRLNFNEMVSAPSSLPQKCRFPACHYRTRLSLSEKFRARKRFGAAPRTANALHLFVHCAKGRGIRPAARNRLIWGQIGARPLHAG